jgi:NAD(P)-dependent dehydrogenase (short-subunit alcohol dehydrogenase family)
MSAQKVAIITAGGSGMGAASARKLAQDGFAVAILSSSGKGEALAKELGGIGVTGSNQSADDLKKLVDLTIEKWGRIDTLVNSAGHGPRAPILDITDEDWHKGLDTYFLKRRSSEPSCCPYHATAKIRHDHQYLDCMGF